MVRCLRRWTAVAAGCAALSTAVHAAEGGGGGGNVLVSPTIGLSIWTFVTFVLLALLLGKFAWRPLVAAIDARERQIQGSVDEANAAREQAASLLDEHRELVHAARRERAEAVAAGQQDAEKLKAEILEQAKGQREQLLQQAQQQIHAEMRQAKAEMRTLAADISIQAAEKLLRKNLDPQTQRKLIEEYLSEIEASDSLPS